MKAGNFNIHDYLSSLNEQEAGTVKNSGEGIMIQDGESKKAYDWLKKEYAKGKTEVKVEMKMGGQNFQPSMEFQTDLKSINNFKSGIFGEIKTSDTEGGTKDSSNEKKIDKAAGNEGSSDKSTETPKAEKTEESGESKKKESGEAMKIEATSKKKRVNEAASSSTDKEDMDAALEKLSRLGEYVGFWGEQKRFHRNAFSGEYRPGIHYVANVSIRYWPTGRGVAYNYDIDYNPNTGKFSLYHNERQGRPVKRGKNVTIDNFDDIIFDMMYHSGLYNELQNKRSDIDHMLGNKR